VDPHLARLQRELSSVISGLSPQQLSWHDPDKWCAAEILEHLFLTYTGTLKGFSRVLEANKSLASPITWKNRGQAFVVVGLGYMPAGRKSPPTAAPRGLQPEKVTSEIVPALSELDDMMTRCAGKLGARTPVLDHPILGPFSVNQWRKFHLVHGLHHVKQIRRLREKMKVPSV